MKAFVCDDGTILFLNQANFITTFYMPESRDFVIRVEFSECSYIDLKFDKEVERNAQYNKILTRLP